MTMLYYCLIFFLVMAIFRIVHWQVMGAFCSFLVLIFSHDMVNVASGENWLHLLAFLSMVYLLLSDVFEKKKESSLLKYNPLYKNNSLPKWLARLLCFIAVVVSIIKLAMLLWNC